MCGYFANIDLTPEIIEVSNQLGLTLPNETQRAYQRQNFNALVTKSGSISQSSAMWWYALKSSDNGFVVDERITSFNARDLTKPLWSEAFKLRRGLVFASELGESQGKQQYLMQSKTGFALGCIYKDWIQVDGSVTRSFAVITRPPHKRYSEYHSKSTPLFLPLDADVLTRWLDPAPLYTDLNQYVEQAVLTTDFDVYPVKTYRSPDSLLPPFELLRD
ncbi:SOS response-associated peptidase family protein [Marinicellulosiphila megalodicopiae]|uniref:SOS response-associated peptidase family protein n=1 Tax=Marinicellulosiphila megalodicopiae TaxID=2724896 RepID=UPI003BAFCAF7